MRNKNVDKQAVCDWPQELRGGQGKGAWLSGKEISERTAQKINAKRRKNFHMRCVSVKLQNIQVSTRLIHLHTRILKALLKCACMRVCVRV